MSLRGKKEKKEKINLFKVAFGNRTNIFHSCTFVSFVGAFPGFVCQNRQIVQQSWAEYAVFIRLPSDVGGGGEESEPSDLREIVLERKKMKETEDSKEKSH